jgi:di/tricarboxylate transporter
VQIFDLLLNIFHFSLPFGINCISGAIIIITVARTRSNSQKKKSFKEHLREQLHQLKHLLIAPSILIVLPLPRLIISFLAGCMKSARDSWFYLIDYFVSLIPSMMTFVVFVLPSEMYKKEFNESIKRFW